MAMTQYGLGQHIWTLSDDILVLYFRTVMALVQCIPIQAVWDHGIDGKCIPNQPTLCLGFFNIAISVLRLQWLTPAKDLTWWNVTPAYWSLAEMVSGLGCACLPTLKPLLYRAKTWFPRTRFGDSTICLQDDSCDRNIELSTTVIGGKDTSSDRRTQPSMDADENERNTR
ncbi:hypothetical protein FPSE_11586 [Fusarium pseudograminearum CS3096]|uniref:Rhodopsin domain-containing protein n=1 Tax=Fusarium pseudograminearum (strain CS3096) TaxID=1028729 RepID=K3V532_FUSPC|nr:hypothetical protein FPSE_11586 [Fusarium pseudograminearum CS3096]EKJ68247.1 hypothetical protein FPSE_11586 [Fusarium pseudograminearum CS3096]